jgi:hypothetical protein
MSETLTTPPQEEHELDNRIRKAENKLGQKVLNKLFNFEDAGVLVTTKKVGHLHGVRDADRANEQLRKDYTGAYVNEQATMRDVEDEKRIIDQIEQDRNEKLTPDERKTTAYEDITDWRNKETRREYAAITRTEDAKAGAREFYEENKDKLHEAAFYDAKTAGVEIKSSSIK